MTQYKWLKLYNYLYRERKKAIEAQRMTSSGEWSTLEARATAYLDILEEMEKIEIEDE